MKNKAKRAAPSETQSTASRVAVIQHVRQGSNLEYIVEDLCELNARCHGSLTTGSDYEEKVRRQWLSGDFPPPLHPWAVCIRLVREKWMFLTGPMFNDEMLRKVGRMRKLRTIVLGYDSAKSQTYFRSYSEGKIEIDFHATGDPAEPLGKMRFKGTAAVKSKVQDAKSPDAAIGVLLKHYDAQRMRLQVVEKGSCLQVLSHQGQKLPLKNLKDLDLLDSYPLIPGDNPGSDLLREAINEGDSKKFGQALKNGADLQYLPEGGTPLGMTLIAQKGDWQAWTRRLVKSGAPIDGSPGERPIWWEVAITLQRHEHRWVDAIDQFVEIGGDLDLQDRSPEGTGQTALHYAVRRTNPIMVKALVAHGADVNIVDDEGNTPLSLARQQAEDFRGYAGEVSAEIAKLLKSAKAGRLNRKKLRESVEQEQAQLREEAEAAQTAKMDEYAENLAEIVVNLPEDLEVAASDKIKVPAKAAKIEPQFIQLGFSKIGMFHVCGTAEYNLIAFHHKAKKLYGMIAFCYGQVFLNLARFHRDGTIFNCSNESLGYDLSPWCQDDADILVRKVVLQDAAIDQLLTHMKSLGKGAAGVLAIREDEFLKRFKQMLQQDLEGQKRVASRMLEG